MPKLSLELGVQNARKIGGGGATPSGIDYANASALTISAINFTLLKTTYGNDAGIINYWGSPHPSNWYGWSDYNYGEGSGNQAILAFNTTASVYFSQQAYNIPDVSLSSNKWYLIVFSAGFFDSDNEVYPPVPSTVYVNNSTIQTASYIPTSSWSPSTTIQGGMYVSADVGIRIAMSFGNASGYDIIKQSNTLWSGDNGGDPSNSVTLEFISSKWVLTMFDEFLEPIYIAESTLGTSSIIPLFGWSYTFGSGVTISLAPYQY